MSGQPRLATSLWPWNSEINSIFFVFSLKIFFIREKRVCVLTDDGVGALFEVLVRAGLGRGLQGLDVHHEALVVLVKRKKIFTSTF